jgi:hypothetical protein
LAFEAADAFLRTLGVEQIQASAERRLTFARQTVEDTTTRFEAKLVSVNDVTRALGVATAGGGHDRSGRDPALSGAVGPSHRYSNRRAAGDPGESPVTAGPRRPKPAGHRGAGASSRSRGRPRPRDALEAFAEEPGRRLIPVLGLTSQVEETFEAGPNERDWFVGLNLTWPLYDGGERGADRNERLALAKIADLEVVAAQRQIERDVRQALIAIESDRAATRQATVAVRVGRKNAEEVTTLYRQGLAGALTVADANIRLFEAEVALARAAMAWGFRS